MRAAPDNRDRIHAGQPDDAATPGGDSARDAQPSSVAATRADRLGAGRRMRRRARLRQAVAGRRRTLERWTDRIDRRWLGAALLAVVGLIVWVEIGLLYAPSDDPARAGMPADATGQAAPAGTGQELAALPRPTTEPAMLTGPEIHPSLIEANGPIAGCTFDPRLSDLRERIGTALVGACVEDPRLAAHGETRQRTTRGELVWWPGERRAVFADDTQTWIVGPAGIVKRRNEERFAWEADADAGPRPTASSFVLPPALPGAVLPARRIVSYYGNPLSSGMGILGELPPERLFPKLRDQAAAYQTADRSRTVTPALELVAVVAQAQPGADGLYRLRMDPALIERVARWADEHGFLLILDVQIGRGTVEDEVAWLMPFLKRPNVHLALDPEFAMPRNQVPGQRIGTMDATAINVAQRMLAELVEREGLPPKLLVVHRFTEEMVTGYQQIATDPKVQVVMVMDGFGNPAIKASQYDTLVVEQRVQYTGFKLFYRHDEPLMTPEQVLLLDPPPDLVIYQ